MLESDELWSFVLKKTNQAWFWISLYRKTRQVVAYAIGNRNEKTCRLLREAIPEAYRAEHCFTDFWSAYRVVIAEEQHTAVGKETGETAHVERWNNTFRQRLVRFIRKTLSFSKLLVMHDISLRLFLHCYNLERASILNVIHYPLLGRRLNGYRREAAGHPARRRSKCLMNVYNTIQAGEECEFSVGSCSS